MEIPEIIEKYYDNPPQDFIEEYSDFIRKMHDFRYRISIISDKGGKPLNVML